MQVATTLNVILVISNYKVKQVTLIEQIARKLEQIFLKVEKKK